MFFLRSFCEEISHNFVENLHIFFPHSYPNRGVGHLEVEKDGGEGLMEMTNFFLLISYHRLEILLPPRQMSVRGN